MFSDSLMNLLKNSGFAAMTWQSLLMILISFVLIYFAIGKKFEPLLLLPIAFGMLLANLPLTGLMYEPVNETEVGGLLYYLYLGVKKGIYPS
ncbi:MAG: glutaconyl-CoA decarboxylase beta subunit, partial [Herbinix sp.]|nr:glutaconyl-CoA decarboxylase beta subunit [Herbinix sp.]